VLLLALEMEQDDARASMAIPDLAPDPRPAGIGGQARDLIPQALYEALESPSLFERLLRIAACRNTATGTYDSDQAAWFDTSGLSDALQGLHVETLMSWLSLPLARQKADIGMYVNRSAASARKTVKQLLGMAEQACPPAAPRAARQLFMDEIRVVQALLQHDD
jgi:hypothetical protein